MQFARGGRSGPWPSVPRGWAGAPTWLARDSCDRALGIVDFPKCTRPQHSATPYHRCAVLALVCRMCAQGEPGTHPACRLFPAAGLRRSRAKTSRAGTSRRSARFRRLAGQVPPTHRRISARNRRDAEYPVPVAGTIRGPALAVSSERRRSRRNGVSCLRPYEGTPNQSRLLANPLSNSACRPLRRARRRLPCPLAKTGSSGSRVPGRPALPARGSRRARLPPRRPGPCRCAAAPA